MLVSFVLLGGGSDIGDNNDMKKSKMDGEICNMSARERGNSYFSLFFKIATAKLGEVLGEDYADLLPVLGKLATSTTVAELMANEELQKKLCAKAGDNDLLMLGFIGRCKVLYEAARAPAPIVATPVGECFFSYIASCVG